MIELSDPPRNLPTVYVPPPPAAPRPPRRPWRALIRRRLRQGVILAGIGWLGYWADWHARHGHAQTALCLVISIIGIGILARIHRDF